MLSTPKVSLILIGTLIAFILLTKYSVVPNTYHLSALPSYADIKSQSLQHLSALKAPLVYPSPSEKKNNKEKDNNDNGYKNDNAAIIDSSASQKDTSPSWYNASITNSTLGFEKVFAIGLRERSDKRDALALMSSLVGFDIEWVDGVRGESVPDKAVPFGTDRKLLWENNLGSWRSHMNAVRGIVEGNLTSALIMEDDMDWDVRLKTQLIQISAGTRHLQTLPPYAPPVALDIAARIPLSTSPYGSDWDLLWLGHCGEVFPDALPENHIYATDATTPQHLSTTTKYTISNDPTVPPPDHTKGFQTYSDFPHTRWVHQTGGPICTFAYALSQRGAQKVLYDLSIDHLTGPFDNSLADLCRFGKEPGRLGMRCFSVTPGLFSHHKAKGLVSGDSDIQAYGGRGDVRDKGHSENIVWSARLNIGGLLRGGQMESEYPSERVGEKDRGGRASQS